MHLLSKLHRDLVLIKIVVTVTATLSSSIAAYSEERVITTEANYIMGDGESPSFAEAMVLQKAKQLALEEAGTYVESYSRMNGVALTHDEVTTLAGGILEVAILDRSRTLVQGGLRFFIKLRVRITTEAITNLYQRVKDESLVKEYVKLQAKYSTLERELAAWKGILSRASSGSDREMALDEIRNREKAFALAQQSEFTVVRRIISGEQVVAAVAAQLHSKEQGHILIDHLIQQLMRNGFAIDVGKPTISTQYKSQSAIRLRIPVTVQVTSSGRKQMEDTAMLLNGPQSPTRISAASGQWTFLVIATDQESNSYFHRQLQDLTLLFEIAGDDSVLERCVVPFGDGFDSLKTVRAAGSDYVGIPERPHLITFAIDTTTLKAQQIRVITGSVSSKAKLIYETKHQNLSSLSRCTFDDQHG
ncbi:MAG: hypothetical protein E8D42_06900 [Nitrospira sp.]|nr:MAG: hypothetical protein E8D42_06900 [Nitrospira sp.]